MLSKKVEELLKTMRMQLLFNKKTAAFYIPFSYLPVAEDYSTPTFATDGRQIVINPNFLDIISLKEAIGALFHEYMHNALGHTSKDFPEVKHKNLLTIAEEIAVNNIVLECGLELPEGVIIERSYSGQSTLAIYYDLVEKAEENEEPRTGCGCCVKSIKSDIPEKDLPDPITQSKMSQVLAQVQNLLDSSGLGNTNLSTVIGELIEDVAIPIIDWADELFDTFVKSFDGCQLDLSRPVTQYLPNIYIPKYKDNAIDSLFIALDLSSSLTKEELSKAQKVIDEIRDIYEIEETDLITYNWSVIERKTYAAYEPLNISDLEGKGGTRADSVFEMLIKNKECPHALLIISDTEDEIRTKAKDVPYPVIWLNTSKYEPFRFSDSKPEFGKIITI